MEHNFKSIFAEKECGGKLGGCFQESEIPELLEAGDYEHIDFLSLFYGEFVVTISGYSSTNSLTRHFSRYTNHINFSQRRFLTPEWTEFELGLLNSRINKVRTVAAKLFEHHQSSNIGTSKWQYLSHSDRANRKVERNRPLDADS